MERECFRHGLHERWQWRMPRRGGTGKWVCGICACEGVKRVNTKKNYQRVLEAQGAAMADSYLSAVKAGIGVTVTSYLNGTAKPIKFESDGEPPVFRVGPGAGRQWTVKRFAEQSEGIHVCERCHNPPPPNGILRAKMIIGPVDGGKKTRDNVMILCPVCRSLTISAIKRSAPPVWDGEKWQWAQVIPQDIENLWIYAAKWMTPEQRVQYANRSIEVGMGTERDVTYDALHGPASVGARFIYPAERPDLGREGARPHGPRRNGATLA